IGSHQFRHRRARQLPRFAYHTTYLCLAPFLGPRAADEFIDNKRQNAERHEQERQTAADGHDHVDQI
ncbi:MAG TPA: hypothetical protein VES65_02715, partial [Solirubrobacteraceae bacterium]|nr:hypothetical protein [Solirubrobacteraceae bacterium]